ncbi:MAG: electron transfer flavoprotein subunit alpha/FixB family protein [Bacteroidia bacterium]|nr:electron transfer flavoprotein subunit alpha/FixB family protein [Bacteroidia bacterium]MDW8158567.1 electron transfer flavoprotein subunit alpha/FixB family protein [Bacteroidia bacterium]
MAILVFLEVKDNKIRKQSFEAATYAYDLAQMLNMPLKAVCIGNISGEEVQKAGRYGVEEVYQIKGQDLDKFLESPYASAVVAVAQAVNAQHVVVSQTFNGKSIVPRLAIKLGVASFSGVIALPTIANGEIQVKRTAYSGKTIQIVGTKSTKCIFSVKNNAYKITENPVTCSIVDFEFKPSAEDRTVTVKEVSKLSDKVSLTEADVIVSAGRGLKGPENWGMIEELASLLGAATACSKPVADVHWRPHHEHVGQTGIQVAPNVYIAIGISGAIQHLAGVNASKTIIVINKDPEAPFFKAADYGVVGDAFEVVPNLIQAIKSYKG